MKNERLDWELRHAKKRLLKTENARMEAETYITEQHEALNDWSDAYDYQSNQLDNSLDMIEEWFALDIDRRKFDSFAEVDDLLLKTTTKEFIRLMAFSRAAEVKEKQRVVNINLHKDLRNVVDDISDKFKKIEGYFSNDGHLDIQSLIEAEKVKFLNEKERSTDFS